MPQRYPTTDELKELEKALNSDVKSVSIRLRKGEYQFSLAKAIATFELELCSPDVKDLIKKLFGEEKTQDARFVSKIQTILKKMEKSGAVKILPKEKPWDLQKYAITSFKFQDVEKNEIVFATKAEIEKTRELIRSRLKPEPMPVERPKDITIKISLLVSIIIALFAVILWALTQPTINLIAFISAFCMAAACSTILGISIARKK